MAPEIKTKKRKASVPEDEVEKVRKVKKLATEALPKKRKASEDATTAFSKKSKSTLPAGAPTKSALKKSKTSEAAEEVLAKKPKSSKDVLKAEKKLKDAANEVSDDDEEEVSADESDPDAFEVVDDQTEALLKGFESDDEDEKVAQGRDRDGDAEPIPELDKKTRKKMRKLIEQQAAKEKSEGPGVVYLGRIPHGFYENEMRQYFTQFGTIKNVRLSRNPHTGASKHYAFIEFESGDVADIVSKTMDNYLMFGHILKCKVVPKDQVHDNLFVGANRRFKKVPWNKMEGRRLAMGKGETQWEKKIGKENERREKKKQTLKAKGIDYEFSSPALKSTKDVPKSKRTSLIVAATTDEEEATSKAIEAPQEVVSTVSVTTIEEGGKKKKAKKSKVVVDGVVAEETISNIEVPTGISAQDAFTSVTEAPSKKKSKKDKKVVGVTEEEPAVAAVEIAEEAVAVPANGVKKTKSKKAKAKTAV